MNQASQIVVLYTGGTIGMQQGPDGLEPTSGFEQRIRQAQATLGDDAWLPEWRFIELLPPIDSANMRQTNWLAMRDSIVEATGATDCSGILLLHGTDTLAYTAAALSFLLMGLPIPVLLSGSMLPADAAGSDAWDNLFGAMSLLQQGIPPEHFAAPVAPGVHIYFAGQLLPGTRTSKFHSESFAAFQALPRTPEHSLPAPAPSHLDYRVRRSLSRIAVQPIYPGLESTQLRAVLDSGVQGLILECYGSGTGPVDDDDWLRALHDAHTRGVVLLAISQCPSGCVVFETYAAGSRLRKAGLVCGGGMTREAALGKLFSLLGCGLSQSDVEYWLQRNLCAEAVWPIDQG
ncbi:asparaginase [Pseudomonas sp. ABC1]|uniref:asparaginase n=1 Tax=Pseudomonas sp. ABC1 TaxID=2748080 RepID=UPI0015C31D9A|nr:asparaginase [Pseudomonas sp. ABC1]QLF91891.1 asparaginase [Pseudomonas sp. ABC1]